jgi:hypothetical protein
MQLETMSLNLRPRSMWEGGDLGIRLLQSRLHSVYRTYLLVALPLFVLCYATVGIAPWLPALLIWLSKPWLDRTILFSLSRALFGEDTSFALLWRSGRTVWWSEFLLTVTLRRLSASRSFSQPVRQLEGLSGKDLDARLRQMALRHRGVTRMLTQTFAAAELALWMSLISLRAWLVPHNGTLDWRELLQNPAASAVLWSTLAYAAVVAFLEPFYVAAGFGMYVNRRVELEAWDIEQEFRRAFAG